MKTGRKVMVVGLDGMEPFTAKRLVDEGKMPNLKKLIERGAARKDLMLLGAMPTITPAQWTTLACGCYPGVHGVTDFWNQAPDALDTIIYGLDSRLCQAEQLWNVTAESGLKTLVWQWPGSSWPPSSKSENLMVVDGTQPASVNYSIANIDIEKYVVASKDIEEVQFIDHIGSKNLGDAATDCVIDELDLEDDSDDDKYAEFDASKAGKANKAELLLNRYKMKRIKNVDFHPIANNGGILAKVPFDQIQSPISEPTKWAKELPEGALEFITYTSGGQMRRPCLILKNADGIYDTVEVYQTKKSEEPLCVLKGDEIATDVVDECLDKGKKTTAARWYKLLELAPDGSKVRMWMSTAFKVDCDDRWSPKSIYQEVIDNCGYVPPFTQMGGTSLEFAQKILTPSWRLNALWQSRAINYLIKEKDLDVVFSHHHFIDHSAHQFWNYALQKPGAAPEAEYQKQIDKTYEVADEYIGSYMHLLDEGWDIIVTSDHGEQIHTEPPARLGSAGGVSAGIMKELGWTVMKKDENGNDTAEIDWEHTKALAVRTSYIWINLKGRDEHGIVDPADKYDVEEAIIDSLYRYKDADGNRIIAMAFHNKDAEVLGLNGPYTGDIVYMNREHFVTEHGQGLSTYRGYYGTSVSPIFVAGGNGIKHDDDVKRTIRQVDVAPTIASLLGVRMPADCEGAPVYQILDDYQNMK
ncbi:MAG: alkaline phosphatase family protein [Peptococcaceae bacterium]|nr:alkaline phosphatase family protein [Peptococcaceae bacterium]